MKEKVQLKAERYLGIDLGEKRIGLAISDPTRIIAQPLKTIEFQSKKQFLQDLQQVIEQYGVVRIVVGLPQTLKGGESRKTAEIQQMVNWLKKQLKVPIEVYDERLTTVQAHRALQEMQRKPSRERNKVDQLAAVFLLQSFLDREKAKGVNHA